MNINQIDNEFIKFAKGIALPLARWSLAIIFIWFGVLKIVGVSPASALVESLFALTIGALLPFITFQLFMIVFGLFEVCIGLLFVIPRCERVAFILFFVHFLTTTLPLIILPALIWTGILTPTLEGQYIIKNLALLACAVFIIAQTQPISRRYLDVKPISSFR